MIALNEKNIQSSFCYNPNTGIYEPRLVKNNISLSSENQYIKIYDDKAIIDLGYSIDNSEENPPIIKIDDKILTVIMLEYETDLLGRNIKNDEAIIITSVPELCTSIFISSENIADDKNMHYEIESLNTSLPSWMLDYIAKNIHHNIPTLENDVVVNKKNINILDNRVDKNDSDILSLAERITSNDGDIENINTDISNIDERVSTNHNNIENLNNTKQNNLIEGTNITIKNNVISAQSTDASLSGMIMAFAGSIDKIPTNAFFADGREISRITYAKLFEKLGILWGAGNGTTTFNIPDGRSGVLKGSGLSDKYDINVDRGAVGSYENTGMPRLYGFLDIAPYGDKISIGVADNVLFKSSRSSRAYNGLEWTANYEYYTRFSLDSSRVVANTSTVCDNGLVTNYIIFI